MADRFTVVMTMVCVSIKCERYIMTSKSENKQIAANKRAFHEYFIELRTEAGLALQGWEIKSLRAGKVQLAESYVIVKAGEVWVVGMHISPLISASTHIQPDPTRTRKLLLHRKEIDRLTGCVERQGYTIVPVSLYFKKGRAKLEIALAKGKKQHDKRATEKAKAWQLEKARILKGNR